MSSASPPLYFPECLDILPFIALPVLVLLSFASPPFPGRGRIFAALIIFTNYKTTVSHWPPNAGSTRPMRYGLTGSWIFVLPAVERLLLHQPERDFWRLDEEKKPRHGRPREWTWDKLRWAAALVTTPRGVGWNFGSRKVNAARQAMRRNKVARVRFLAAKLVRAMLAYLALDAVVLFASNTEAPREWAWDTKSLARISFQEFFMGTTVFSTMTLQFEITAAISVGLGLSRPEDWPPLFGSILDCYKVANVWGTFWHGYIRQPALGFSRAMIDFFGIPKGSTMAYLAHLTTAFLISAFFHILSLFVVCPGYISPKTLILDMTRFFMMQPLGTIVETLVLQHCHEHASTRKLVTMKQGIRYPQTYQRLSSVTNYAIGYLWVVLWFTFTRWWFFRDFIAIGVVEWPLPFSFWNAIGVQDLMQSEWKNLSLVELTAALNRMERKIDDLTDRIPQTQSSVPTIETVSSLAPSLQPVRGNLDSFPSEMRSPSFSMQNYFVPSTSEFLQHPGELSLAGRHSTAPEHLLLWPCSLVKPSEAELSYPMHLEIKQPRLLKTKKPPVFLSSRADENWLSHLSLHQLRQLTQLYFSHFHPPYLIVDESSFHTHHLATALRDEFRHGIDSTISLLVLSLGAIAAYHTGDKEWAQPENRDDPSLVGLGLFNLACEIFEKEETVDWTSVQCLLLMGVFYGSKLKIYESWKAIHRACCTILILLPLQTALEPHQCQLYWVAYLHESQILAEFDFPPSGLGVYASSVPLPLVPDSSQDAHQEYQFFFLAHIAMRRLLNRILFHLFNRKKDEDRSSHTGSPSAYESNNLLFPSHSVISELDRQLEEWRACLPAALQFPPYSESQEKDAPEPYQPRDIHKRLLGHLMARYFAAKSIIHRPFVYRALHHGPASFLTEGDKLGARVALDSASLSVLYSGLLHEPMALLLHPINSCRTFYALALQLAFVHGAGEACSFALPADLEIIQQVQDLVTTDAAPLSPTVSRDMDILRSLI
ncbi:hypothetical protein AK830_g11153 [Neonectria ditissima]|uniref:Wax synthase domain-containing protein n=1 Tax=Neonectria ditissima TaxID=78410 RepID=A0A0P7B8R9_9HYPO|nr:hypothetical protein AK830_g11153 [Neonectria ditissima]